MWNPHFAKPLKGRHTVNERHEPVIEAFSTTSSSEFGQINHYHYRAWQDYREKLLRGRADKIARNILKKINPPAGDVPDTSALRFVPALRAMLKREDRAICLAQYSKRFSRKLSLEQVLAEACALIAHDRQEEALTLLSNAAAREPGQALYVQARRMIKASLTAAA
jgi:hypothetical protein